MRMSPPATFIPPQQTEPKQENVAPQPPKPKRVGAMRALDNFIRRARIGVRLARRALDRVLDAPGGRR